MFFRGLGLRRGQLGSGCDDAMVEDVAHGREHATTDRGPRHLFPVLVGASLELPLPLRVAKHRIHRGRDRRRIAERDEDAAAALQHFFGVEVWRGDDRLPRAERVREGAARDLVRIEVRGDIDIRREEVVHDLALGEVLVHELDVIAHPQARSRRDERVPIRLAFPFLQLGVRLADDEIESGGMASDDLRHRLDDVLEALPRVDEPEGGDDRTLLDAELPLESMASPWLDGGHAVLDHHRRTRYPVDLAEQTCRGRAPDDDLIAALRDVANGLERPRLRLWRDGVQSRDHGLRAVVEEYAQVVVVGSVVPHAVETELVLHVDDVHVRFAYCDRRVAVRARLLLTDAPADIWSVSARGAPFVDGCCVDPHGRIGRFDGRGEVRGERGDATPAGN